MKQTRRFSMAIVCAVAVLVVMSCSNSDDAVNIPVDQAVESGLNSALSTTVVPVFEFMGAVTGLLSTPFAGAVAGASCPDTSGWCSSGTVACTIGTIGLDFNFDECQLITGDAPLLVDGNVTAIPGTPVYLTLTNLFINNNAAVSGTGTIDVANCDYVINIYTNDATVTGTVTQCSSDEYPTGDQVIISFGDFVVTVLLNGSSLAPATAMQNGTPVADCTIDLAANPLSSSCDVL